MIDLAAIVTAFLFSLGLWLIFSRRWIMVIMGISILGQGINMIILRSAGPQGNLLPQALLLTAIVIGLAIQAFLLVLAYLINEKRSCADLDQLTEADS